MRLRKQVKRSAYNVLTQTETWYDFEGEAYTIRAMSIRYKRNLLRWLERNAVHLMLQYMWSMPYPNLNGEMAQDAAEHEWDREQTRLMNTPAIEWIVRTPLYEAVQSSVARGEDGPQGDDPEKLERYKAAVARRADDALALAEEATWD